MRQKQHACSDVTIASYSISRGSIISIFLSRKLLSKIFNAKKILDTQKRYLDKQKVYFALCPLRVAKLVVKIYGVSSKQIFDRFRYIIICNYSSE